MDWQYIFQTQQWIDECSINQHFLQTNMGNSEAKTILGQL